MDIDLDAWDDTEMEISCEKCGAPDAEDVPAHGVTKRLCEGCARREAPYMFSDRRGRP